MNVIHEKRQVHRFAINGAAIIASQASRRGLAESHLLLMHDISCNGAYFLALRPIDLRGQVHIEVMIDTMRVTHGAHYICMETWGEVVRCDRAGVAVWFDSEMKFIPWDLNKQLGKRGSYSKKTGKIKRLRQRR